MFSYFRFNKTNIYLTLKGYKQQIASHFIEEIKKLNGIKSFFDDEKACLFVDEEYKVKQLEVMHVDPKTNLMYSAMIYHVK